MPDAEDRGLAVLLKQLAHAHSRLESSHQLFHRHPTRLSGILGGTELLGRGGHGVELDQHAKAHPILVVGSNLVSGLHDAAVLTQFLLDVENL